MDNTLTGWMNQLFIDIGAVITNGVKVALMVIGIGIVYKSANKIVAAVAAAATLTIGWWAITSFDDSGISEKINNETSMEQIQPKPPTGEYAVGTRLDIHPRAS